MTKAPSNTLFSHSALVILSSFDIGHSSFGALSKSKSKSERKR